MISNKPNSFAVSLPEGEGILKIEVPLRTYRLQPVILINQDSKCCSDVLNLSKKCNLL